MRLRRDDRRVGGVLGLLALLLALCPGRVGAQGLPTLTVTALGMHADVSRATVGQLFHIIIHVHVAQPNVGLEELVVLPDYTNLQPLGDTRATTSSASGTDYVETLSVSGLNPGPAHVSPVTLDAIDSKTGRPSRFSSNALTIQIVDQTMQTDPVAWITHLALRVVRWTLAAIGILAAIFILLALFRTRRARVSPPVAPGPPAPAPPPPPSLKDTSPLARLRVGIDRLRREPTRAHAFEVRAELFTLAGGRDGETLGSVLGRLDGNQPALRSALRMAERAAFVDEAYVRGAIDDLLPAAERVTAS